MEVKEKGSGLVSIYLDELSVIPFVQLLRRKNLQKVVVLDPVQTKMQKLLRFLLSVKGVAVADAVFFSGDFRNDTGEAIPFYARRMAAQIACKAAKQTIEGSNHLLQLNIAYGRNTLILFVAKKLHLVIEHWVHRILIARALGNANDYEIWLKEADLFDQTLLTEKFPLSTIRFYPSTRLKSFRLVYIWAITVIRSVRATLGIGRHYTGHFSPVTNNKPSVLFFQENTNIRTDRRLRAQPHHWLDGKDVPETFNAYMVETRSFTRGVSAEDKELIEKQGVTFLSMKVFAEALRKYSNSAALRKIRKERKATIRSFFGEKGYINKYFLLQIYFLQKQAEKIGALAIWLNIKVYINREPQNSFADAIQLVSHDLGITTISYQYSNMGSISPMMMTTADKMLIFSENYKKVYQFEDISPKELLVSGYLYDGIAPVVSAYAQQHRKQLNDAGAQFVICYFDETIETSRWGLVSKESYLHELHELSKLILSDPSIGLVLKSQYMRNSPSQLYPDDELIQKAKATGRYLELMEGVHRNEIYPTEAALVSDLCISHKFGATAGLEAAIAGVRTILLDTYGCTTIHDDVYTRADIIYNSMESILTAVAEFREGKGHPALGDWMPVLDSFDPHHDGKAPARLFTEIVKGLSS